VPGMMLPQDGSTMLDDATAKSTPFSLSEVDARKDLLYDDTY
jgi:hypothetical protein